VIFGLGNRRPKPFGVNSVPEAPSVFCYRGLARGSCTVLGARGGETPPRDSTLTSVLSCFKSRNRNVSIADEIIRAHRAAEIGPATRAPVVDHGIARRCCASHGADCAAGSQASTAGTPCPASTPTSPGPAPSGRCTGALHCKRGGRAKTREGRLLRQEAGTGAVTAR
jgi:hypothetical protein